MSEEELSIPVETATEPTVSSAPEAPAYVRPAWLEEKYGHELEFVEAHKSLQKRLGAGAPPQYELKGFEQDLNPEDPKLKSFLEYAKSNHMSQEMVSKALEVSANVARTLKVDEIKELERLGMDGPIIKERLQNWINNMLPAKGQEAFKRIPKTAEMLNLMNEVRLMQSEERTPTPMNYGAGIVADSSDSTETIQQEMIDNMPRFHADKAYREDVRKRLAKSLGE